MHRAVLAVVLLVVVLIEGAAGMSYLTAPPMRLATVQHCTHACVNNAALLDPSTIIDQR